MHSDTKVFFWKHWPVIDQDEKKLIDATIAFQEMTRCDIIKIPMPGTWQVVSYGAKDEIWQGDQLGRRFISEPLISNPKDWLELTDFSTSEPDMLIKMCQVTNEIKSRTKGETVWATIFNPISIAIQLSGIETFKKHCKTAPDLLKIGLKKIMENNIYCFKKFKQYGADGIYLVSQYMQNNLLPSRIYSEFGKADDEILMKSSGIFNTTLFHIHGSEIDPVFGYVPENTFIHFENTSHNRSIMMNFFKQHGNLIAGIPASDIQDLDDAESIRKYIAHLKRDFPKMKIFSSGCVLPYNIADNQIMKWIEIIKKTI